MEIRISKKKIDLNGRFDKKDIHNILNSLLVGIPLFSKAKLSRRICSMSFGITILTSQPPCGK
jgi:hypothetical protein